MINNLRIFTETPFLKKSLPVFTIIRKEKPLDEAERLKVESRTLSHSLEAKEVKEEKYQNKRKQYFQALSIVDEIANQEENNKQSTKTPRTGIEGCCGKGCNGCLPFWYDEKYSKAREILKSKKIGEMLS